MCFSEKSNFHTTRLTRRALNRSTPLPTDSPKVEVVSPVKKSQPQPTRTTPPSAGKTGVDVPSPRKKLSHHHTLSARPVVELVNIGPQLSQGFVTSSPPTLTPTSPKLSRSRSLCYNTDLCTKKAVKALRRSEPVCVNDSVAAVTKRRKSDRLTDSSFESIQTPDRFRDNSAESLHTATTLLLPVQGTNTKTSRPKRTNSKSSPDVLDRRKVASCLKEKKNSTFVVNQVESGVTTRSPSEVQSDCKPTDVKEESNTKQLQNECQQSPIECKQSPIECKQLPVESKQSPIEFKQSPIKTSVEEDECAKEEETCSRVREEDVSRRDLCLDTESSNPGEPLQSTSPSHTDNVPNKADHLYDWPESPVDEVKSEQCPSVVRRPHSDAVRHHESKGSHPKHSSKDSISENHTSRTKCSLLASKKSSNKEDHMNMALHYKKLRLGDNKKDKSSENNGSSTNRVPPCGGIDVNHSILDQIARLNKGGDSTKRKLEEQDAAVSLAALASSNGSSTSQSTQRPSSVEDPRIAGRIHDQAIRDPSRLKDTGRLQTGLSEQNNNMYSRTSDSTSNHKDREDYKNRPGSSRSEDRGPSATPPAATASSLNQERPKSSSASPLLREKSRLFEPYRDPELLKRDSEHLRMREMQHQQSALGQRPSHTPIPPTSYSAVHTPIPSPLPTGINPSLSASNAPAALASQSHLINPYGAMAPHLQQLHEFQMANHNPSAVHALVQQQQQQVAAATAAHLQQLQMLQQQQQSPILSQFSLQHNSPHTRQLELLWQQKFPNISIPPPWMLHQYQDELLRDVHLLQRDLLDRERREREILEKERAEREQRERAERDRNEKEQRDRVERERLERERQERERAERERQERDRQERYVITLSIVKMEVMWH